GIGDADLAGGDVGEALALGALPHVLDHRGLDVETEDRSPGPGGARQRGQKVAGAGADDGDGHPGLDVHERDHRDWLLPAIAAGISEALGPLRGVREAMTEGIVLPVLSGGRVLAAVVMAVSGR